ncbi:hypothetical protein HPP92_008957 [Vanilla planifolia]|uniref:Uncharacterized protein n=1 Tax=Vanilla planifolia TaxID=51239 RepID=A0A835V660_VANPL|nr:hypothetical protein HPP92_008957 [Vanilla planifolia]
MLRTRAQTQAVRRPLVGRIMDSWPRLQRISSNATYNGFKNNMVRKGEVKPRGSSKQIGKRYDQAFKMVAYEKCFFQLMQFC